MDIFTICVIVAIIIGIILIVISIVVPEDDEQPEAAEDLGKHKYSADTDVDTAMNELDGLARSVLGQVEDKYQELLFLYSLIEEKEKSIVGLPSGEAIENTPKARQLTSGIKSRKLDEIMSYKEDGMSVADIAKHMGIGQGEVRFILEMGKER